MATQHPQVLHYPIRAVARMTGLSLDTLRAWERRYEAVVPRRSGRGRVYTDADVARLRQLGDLVRRGHSIGSIARMPDDELGRLLAGAEAHGARVEAPTPRAALDPLISALDSYDLNTIESVLSGHALVLPPRELVLGVIQPMLQEIGRRWEAGTLRPAQEHLVSAIVRNILGGLLRAARPTASHTVLFATPAGERHELGLLCAALLTASAGYGVLYLGADLPGAEIVDAAATAGVQVVMVSLTTPRGVPRGELKRLTSLPPGVELWVGGPEASALLPDAREDRVRHVSGLSDVIPMLSRHAR